MKTFKDLEFKQHKHRDGLHAILMFKNNYGISVVRFKNMFNDGYASHTDNENQWEIAVFKGDNENYEITYETPITDDVIGYLSEEEVTEVMLKIQNLPNART
jgi:hypothetical protein